MVDQFYDALFDGLKTLPFLFIIYFLIELIEYRFGSLLRDKMAHANKAGPIIGSFFGLIPQCGFSVVGTALYVKRFVTIGTLVAIYLATSDEALPVIISQPQHISLIAPLLATKFIVAVFVGYILDFIFFKNQRLAVSTSPKEESVCDNGCCHHHVSEGISKKELFIHPVRHTITVFVFLVLTTFLINLLVSHYGEENLGKLLLKGSFFQPVVTALIGLIPNCAASVAITQGYLEGGISYGALISGLFSSAGFGLLLLFKEAKNLKEVAKIVGILLAVSILGGFVAQLFVH